MLNKCKGVNKTKKIIKGLPDGGAIVIFYAHRLKKLCFNIRPDNIGTLFILEWLSDKNIWSGTSGNENTRIMSEYEEYSSASNFLIKTQLSENNLQYIQQCINNPGELLNSFLN